MQDEASRSYLFVAIDRSATGECEPTGDHLFDPVCRKEAIDLKRRTVNGPAIDPQRALSHLTPVQALQHEWQNMRSESDQVQTHVK